jgi:hypothetical protein
MFSAIGKKTTKKRKAVKAKTFDEKLPKHWKLLIVFAGIIWAYSYNWLTDDIFITLRYIDQLFEGNGLVYNVGEYVEGYTHPLWLFMIAGCRALGMNPEFASQILGIISFGAVIYLLTRFGWLAAILFVFNTEGRIWATGGLETMFFTFLVLATVWTVIEKRYKWLRWILLALVLTRPDGFVVVFIVLVFIFFENKKDAVKVGLPLLLYLPYLLWRYLYYGDIVPNPYYAKSGGDFYYSQGFYYIWIYLSVYISTFLVFIGLKFIKQREIQLSFAVIFGYIIFFVARVGGDFMYARFIIPLIPLIYFVIEYSLKQFNKPVLLFAILLLIPLEMHLRDEMFWKGKEHKPAFELKGITDEYWYWSQLNKGMTPIDVNRITGEALQRMFGDKKFSVLLRGQASLGYYGKFYDCVENAGLTDKYISHLPLKNRSRPGHEKAAPLDYMKKRGVHFVFNRTVYDTSNMQIQFNIPGIGLRAEVITYDSLVASLIQKPK